MGIVSIVNRAIAGGIVEKELTQAQIRQIAKARNTNAVEIIRNETWAPGVSQWVISICAGLGR